MDVSGDKDKTSLDKKWEQPMREVTTEGNRFLISIKTWGNKQVIALRGSYANTNEKNS